MTTTDAGKKIESMTTLTEWAVELMTCDNGTDPDGWDKPMGPEEMERFMLFNNSDRPADAVDFSE